MKVVFSGTGSYIPEQSIKNEDFGAHEFYDSEGKKLNRTNSVIIEKFKAITGISERRYVTSDLQTSDIASIAGSLALDEAGIDPESLDGIIVAHNYGNVAHGRQQSDTVPSIASRVKFNLKIKNPSCVAYDLLFGCPGWVQGVISARNYILAGEGKRFLVIGAETLSRVIDPHDRDSMIYSDGAAACLVEAQEGGGSGILSVASQSHTSEETYYLYFDRSFNHQLPDDVNYIKMHGHKIYEFALNKVPLAMKDCLDKSGEKIEDLKMILIHQANEKMDEAIVKRFYQLYDMEAPPHIMPMSIHTLGNSSVATVPTLLDLIRKGKMEDHQLNEGDLILLASVGAGMNINAVAYRI